MLVDEIELVVFDIDGVFTNGCEYITSNGVRIKNLFLRDFDYLNLLKAKGLKIAAITGEDNEITSIIETKFDWEYFIKGNKEKDKALRSLSEKLCIDLKRICYIGDGVYDIPAINISGLSMCPSDASREVKQISDICLATCGGNGCVEEVYNKLFEEKNERINRTYDEIRTNDIIDSLVERYPSLREVKQSIMEGFQLMNASYNSGGKLLVAGNGGSASDSEHIVGELMKSFLIKRPIAQSLKKRLRDIGGNDGEFLSKYLERPITAVSLVENNALKTAYSNDVDEEYAVAQQLLGYGKLNDVFLAISTSGNSANIINAAIVAKANGIKVIALTGKLGGKLIQFSDVAVKVPEYDTYKIQELHLPIYHCWCMMLEKSLIKNVDINEIQS